MDLRRAADLLLEQIEEDLTFIAAGYPAHEIPESYDRLTGHFAAVAICRLLANGDEGRFREGLARAAYARRAYLRAARRRGTLDDRRLASSRTDGLFAALAGGHIGLAREIAELTPETWLSTRDYEEDYCWAVILHQLVRRPADPPHEVLDALLARWDAVTGSAPSARFAIARALVARDAGTFEKSLRALMEEEQTGVDGKRPTVVETNALFWPFSFVSLEGLALLRVAELRGIAPSRAIPRCPAEARLSPSTEPPEDPFEAIEIARQGG